MSIHPLALSPFVVWLAVGVVHRDASSRTLARKTRRRWILAVGFVSTGGFLCASAFRVQLARVYLRVSESGITPYGLLMGVFIIGVVSSMLAVSVYAVGSRVDHIA